MFGGNNFIDPQLILTKANVASGGVVADLGCGALGHFVFPVAKQVGDKGAVYAVDIRKLVLEGIKNRARVDQLKNIKTIWANLEIPKTTGLNNNSCDAVLLINTLFQTQKDDDVLTEAVRILKNGGRLLVVDWLQETGGLGPVAEQRVDQNQVTTWAQQAGLKKVDEFSAGQYHFGLVFTK